jgi:hypothetical protein
MLSKDPADVVAIRLIDWEPREVRSGFVTLMEAGHPHLTVEMIMLNPRYAPLFTDEQRAKAYARLCDWWVKRST